jgi:hypothetical protein
VTAGGAIIVAVCIAAVIGVTAAAITCVLRHQPPRRTRRPRIGHKAVGPRIEHINQASCPDCHWWYDDDGTPLDVRCLIHDRPDPLDDLSLWNTEMTAYLRRRLPGLAWRRLRKELTR